MIDNRVPLIGFAGSPWTVLCYMVQGQGSKNFDIAKSFCFSQPDAANMLLEKITTTTIKYLKSKCVVFYRVFSAKVTKITPNFISYWALQGGPRTPCWGDFIEKQRSPIGLLKEPHFPALRSRERAFFVAK